MPEDAGWDEGELQESSAEQTLKVPFAEPFVRSSDCQK